VTQRGLASSSAQALQTSRPTITVPSGHGYFQSTCSGRPVQSSLPLRDGGYSTTFQRGALLYHGSELNWVDTTMGHSLGWGGRLPLRRKLSNTRRRYVRAAYASGRWKRTSKASTNITSPSSRSVET